MAPELGHKITGTIKAVKGSCSFGHKAGDKLEISGYSPGGLCGFFYHDIFPYIVMLQFGGSFPWGDQDVLELECMDRTNAVTLELRREK